MESTQLVLFNEIHVQKVCGQPVTSLVNEQKIRFPRDEEGNVDVKNCQYGTNNQPKKSTFKYEQEGRFFLGVAKIESNNGMITCKQFPVSDYSGKKRSKQIQQLDLLHLLHIVRYLQKGGGGNKA